MTTFPVGLAVALPAITRAASNVVSGVGQSFQSLFAQNEATPTNSSSNSLSFGEQLQEIAGSLRSWLSSHGIDSPFEIELTSSSTGNESVAIQGPQGGALEQLLQSNPGQLEKLRELAKSIQTVAASALGSGSTKLTITDLDSHVSY